MYFSEQNLEAVLRYTTLRTEDCLQNNVKCTIRKHCFARFESDDLIFTVWAQFFKPELKNLLDRTATCNIQSILPIKSSA